MLMEANDLQVKLAVAECEKDLGVNVNKELKFSNHAEVVSNKANRLCAKVRHSFSFMDGEIFKTLFKSLVRPLLEYGYTIWSL